MNQNKKEFLIDRAATVGQKLAAKLQQGSIPSKDEMVFFGACVDAVTAFAPAHGLRVLAMELGNAVQAAKAKRVEWLKGRELALKQAEARKADKAATRSKLIAEAKARKAARAEKQALLAKVIEDVKAFSVPVAPPKAGTVSSQGLPFVAELPLEWQTAEAA